MIALLFVTIYVVATLFFLYKILTALIVLDIMAAILWFVMASLVLGILSLFSTDDASEDETN